MSLVPARLRPRLLGAAIMACLVFAVLPDAWALNSRLLIAWDVGVACFLALA